MNNDFKSKLKKQATAAIIGIIITVGLLFSFNFFSGDLSLEEGIKALADSFTVTGVLFLAFGALIYVSTQGMFDGLSYVGMYAVRTLIPGMRKNSPQKYGDYKLAKEEKRMKGYGYILFIGIGFLVIGIIFTVLFFVF